MATGEYTLWEEMYTYMTVVCQPPHPTLIPQVEKFGKPTWGRLVMAVEDGAGGNNCALAKTIAIGHPGEPGNLIRQFAIMEDLVWTSYL